MNKLNDKVLEELARFERLRDRDPSEKYQKVTFDAAKEATEVLTKALNGGSQRPAIFGILSALRREHRYLQNEAVIVMLSALGLLCEVEGTDARNEFGIGLSRKVQEKLEDDLFYIFGKGT
jgi:hypothetical protein